jgi:hypothetical protein
LAFHSGREADHSPPSTAEVEEWMELYLHSSNVPSRRSAQLGGAQGQLYLLLQDGIFYNSKAFIQNFIKIGQLISIILIFGN